MIKLEEDKTYYLPWSRFSYFVELNGGSIKSELIAPEDTAFFNPFEFKCTDGVH